MTDTATSTDTTTANAQATAEREARERRRTIRRLRTWLKRALLLAIAVFLVGALVLSMLPKPIPVDIATAERGAMQVTVNEDGKTRARNRYALSAPLAGNMPRITLEPGDEVQEEDLLAEIAPATPPLLDARTRAEAQARLAAAMAGEKQVAAQISRAQAARDHAVSESKRLRDLFGSGVASQDLVDQAAYAQRASADELRAAEFAGKVAAQQVASAKAVLGLLGGRGSDTSLEIRAPVTGQVLRIFRRDEQGLVQPGTPLIEVGDLDSLEIVVDVLTADAVHVRKGARVNIHRWGGDKPLAGIVHQVEPSGFTRISALGVEEQRVNVIIRLESPREEWMELGDGYRVEAEILIWEAQDVLMAPVSSVFRHGGNWALFVVEDGHARTTVVEIGHRNDTHAEILSGVSQGTQVVVHPSDNVQDGVAVEQR